MCHDVQRNQAIYFTLTTSCRLDETFHGAAAGAVRSVSTIANLL